MDMGISTPQCLAKDLSGGLLLRESAQCKDEDKKAFQDVTKYKFFNIKLDGMYKFVDAIDKLIPAGPPSLIGCAKLVVEGNMAFSKGVVVKGSVTFKNSTGGRIKVPPRTYADGTFDVATLPQGESFWDIPGMKPGVITGDVAWSLLKFAKKNGFAIPAFNVTGSSSVNSVLEAGAKLGRPVIIQCSEGGSAFFCGKALD